MANEVNGIVTTKPTTAASAKGQANHTLLGSLFEDRTDAIKAGYDPDDPYAGELGTVLVAGTSENTQIGTFDPAYANHPDVPDGSQGADGSSHAGAGFVPNVASNAFDDPTANQAPGDYGTAPTDTYLPGDSGAANDPAMSPAQQSVKTVNASRNRTAPSGAGRVTKTA